MIDPLGPNQYQTNFRLRAGEYFNQRCRDCGRYHMLTHIEPTRGTTLGWWCRDRKNYVTLIVPSRRT